MSKRKAPLAVQDWRATKKLLSEKKTYENAVELQKATRVLKHSVRASLKIVQEDS